jgi:hypothetical protein
MTRRKLIFIPAAATLLVAAVVVLAWLEFRDSRPIYIDLVIPTGYAGPLLLRDDPRAPVTWSVAPDGLRVARIDFSNRPFVADFRLFARWHELRVTSAAGTAYQVVYTSREPLAPNTVDASGGLRSGGTLTMTLHVRSD